MKRLLVIAGLLTFAAYAWAAELRDTSTTDASNTNSSFGFPENMAPSAVNDNLRAYQGQVRRWLGDNDGSVIASGSTSNTILIPATTSHSAYFDGFVIAFESDIATTGAVNINVDSLGEKDLFKDGNSELADADIGIGQKIIAIYDGTQFQMMSPVSNTSAGDMLASNNLSDVSDAGASRTSLGFDGSSGVVTSGDLAAEVDPIARQTVYIPAAGCIPTNTGGAGDLTKVETSVDQPDFSHLPFDPLAPEHCQVSIVLPRGFDESVSFFYQVFWTQSTSASGGVAWFLQGAAVTDNLALAVSYNAAQVLTDTSHATSEDFHTSGISLDGFTPSGSPTFNDRITFRLGRDVSDGDDTMLDDAQFLGMNIYFSLKKANDAE
jgi:hypothetical protein